MPAATVRKVAIMGSPCVGKSSLCIQFISGKFPVSYDPTIEDSFTREYTYNGRPYLLHLIDTAGQHDYSLFPRSCSVDIHGYILVYAIDNNDSFTVLHTIRDKIFHNVGSTNIPTVLVGNKLDLQQSREVSSADGKSAATEWGVPFREISAKESKDVHNVFDSMLYEIEKSLGNIPPAKADKKCTVS